MVCLCVALGIQHAMHMRHIDICGLPPLYAIFPHYLREGMIFGGGFTENTNFILFPLQLLSARFLVLRRTDRHMSKKKKCIGLHVKFRLVLSDFNET